MAAHPFIIMNGIALPAPGRGLNHIGVQTVSAGRNANNEVIGQKVGRTQVKLDGLFWPILWADQWTTILQQVDKFKLDIVFFHPLYNDWKKITMYPGNWTDTVWLVSPTTGATVKYKDCKVNIIDYGILEDVN